MVSRRVFLLSGMAASFAASGCAHESSAPLGAGEAELAALLRTRIDAQHRGTGAVVGLAQGGAFSVIPHGVAAQDGAPVGERSVFQIASLTKVFTALLCADAVMRGEIRWDDPLRSHIPARVPQFGDAPITLLHLATHSSGLPHRPASRLTRSQDDPYAGYTRAELLADIEIARLERAPGAEFEYSNFAYALLGEALAQRTGRSYEELLGARILGPLGMRETSLTPGPDLRARLVQGYDRDMQHMRPWDFGALAPGGGLFSTIADLARFLALWTKPRGALGRAAQTMLTPYAPGDGPDTRMALGWRITHVDGRDIAWSNGSGGGVRSFMGFAPDSGRGVVAFVNMATGGGVDDIGMRALDARYEVDVELVPERVGIRVAPEILDRYVGAYREAPGREVAFERTAEGLVLVLGSGAARRALIAETETLFYIEGENTALEFQVRDGAAYEVRARQGGQEFRYERIQ